VTKPTRTVVSPRSHIVYNFGPDVRSLTFHYNGVDHTINRRGKSNVKVYIGTDTVTVTNGVDSVKRMHASAYDPKTAILNNGVVLSV